MNEFLLYKMSNELSTYVRRDKPENPKSYTLQVFRDNSLSPRPDSELTDLIATSSQYMDDGDLARFLQAQKKFDGPVTMMDTNEKIEHYKLRKCLKELPGYIANAETAGLRYEQAVDVLMHTLGSDRFDFSEVDSYIMLLARVFKTAKRSGINLGQHVDALKDIITFGGKSWGPEMGPSLYMIPIALRLGLSVEQAYKIFKKIDEVGSPATGYVTPHFNDALKSMLPAKVDPALVAEAFELIGDNNGYYAGLYDFFKTIMTFGGPMRGMTPNDVLTLFITRVKTGKSMPLLEAGEGGEQKREVIEVSKEKYFIENENDVLEHAALPYCMGKTLNAGVRDLEKLAVARSHRWEEVGEGMWVFDPKKKIWYSLGGQLELPGMGAVLSGTADRVRHNFIPYDISALSDTPFLFHVHPEGLDSFVSPPRDSMTYPEFRDDITKFLTATPSRADYGTIAELLKQSQRKVPTRSFIAHALGITEFTYPNNIAQLEEMKEKSRDIRDQAMLWFDVEDYVSRNGFSSNRFDLVQRLVHDLDERLPEGFRVILHPVGTDFQK